MKTKSCIWAVLCVLFTSLSAHAESINSDKWEFTIATYACLAGQKGSVATLPGLPATDIDVDFYDDIIGNIQCALFLKTEAHKSR